MHFYSPKHVFQLLCFPLFYPVNIPILRELLSPHRFYCLFILRSAWTNFDDLLFILVSITRIYILYLLLFGLSSAPTVDRFPTVDIGSDRN